MENYLISCSEFSQNAINIFRGQLENEAFADISLACEDSVQIRAHRMVLSGSSLFFKNILKSNPQQNLVLFLKGVNYKDLKNILKFIYNGEARITEDDITDFLAVGKELQVLGLSGENKVLDQDLTENVEIEGENQATEMTKTQHQSSRGLKAKEVVRSEKDQSEEVHKVIHSQPESLIDGSTEDISEYIEMADVSVIQNKQEDRDHQVAEEARVEKGVKKVSKPVEKWERVIQQGEKRRIGKIRMVTGVWERQEDMNSKMVTGVWERQEDMNKTVTGEIEMKKDKRRKMTVVTGKEVEKETVSEIECRLCGKMIPRRDKDLLQHLAENHQVQRSQQAPVLYITMSTQRYELSWKEFDQNSGQTFKQQFNNPQFSDMVLACEDGRQIKSHKMILSACSSFFQKIISENPHPNPLIYLKGVSHDSLQLVLRFMYYGEAKVAESELQTFLDVAAELSVAGLSDASKLKKELGLEEQDAVLEPRSGSDPPQVISSDSNAYLNNPAPAVEDGLTQFPATGSSSPQTHQRQSSVLKKERNRVKCNLCKMVLINEEKFLLAHVQRVHGA